MREFAKISPQFWISDRGKQIKNLGIKAQLIAFYLSTNPHACMIGIYYLPIVFISHETGIEYSDVVATLKLLIDINFCTYDEKTEYIWVHEMGFEQIDTELKQRDNRVTGINDLFEALPELPFLNEFLNKYSQPFHMNKSRLKESMAIEAPSEILSSKDNEKDKEQNKNNKKENDDEVNFNFDKLKVDVKDFDETKQLSKKEQAIKIIHFFNEKVGTNYIPADQNINLILSHLDSGIPYQQFFHVITKKYREWAGNEVMDKFLKIEVIFGSKFTKYLGELRRPKGST